MFAISVLLSCTENDQEANTSSKSSESAESVANSEQIAVVEGDISNESIAESSPDTSSQPLLLASAESKNGFTTDVPQTASEPLLLASAESESGTTKDAPKTAPTMPTPHAMPNMMPHNFGGMPQNFMPYGNPMGMSSAMNPYATMMNPMAMMTPMIGMMNPMMAMMNPQYHGLMLDIMSKMMMNPTIDGFTRAETLDSMMRMMDPKLTLAMMGGTYEQREDDDVPDQLPVGKIPGFPTQSFYNIPKNTVSPSISDEAKKNAFQSVMMMSPLSLRDMLGIMTYKLPLEEDVTWDDAVESMKLRANEVNFKFVGSSPLSKEIEALSGESSPRIEIFRFCDALVARKILDYMPEFIIFLPCKIALIEDADGQIWVMTMDWDVSWLDFAQNPNSHLSRELRADAKSIRENMRYIMEGAATGDL